MRNNKLETRWINVGVLDTPRCFRETGVRRRTTVWLRIELPNFVLINPILMNFVRYSLLTLRGTIYIYNYIGLNLLCMVEIFLGLF